MAKLIADSGFLVALFVRGDDLHIRATDFLRSNRAPLATVSAVIVETCFFLDAKGKRELLRWVERGALDVVDAPVSAYPEIRATLEKYANLDPDFTDAALVWLANKTASRRILTVDEKDFGVYRLRGSKRFELVKWFE